MEIAVVGRHRRRDASADGAVTAARVAMTALAPTIRRVPEAEAALIGQRRRRRRRSTAAGAAVGSRGSADLRRPRLGRLPAGDGGRDRPARDRDGALSRARRGGIVKVAATLTVNGVAYPVELEPGTNLLAAVRDAIGLTGSKEGCDDSECGACMMLLDGQPVNSCSYLALQAEGSEITTVEGLADGRHAGAAAGGVPRPRRRPVRLLHARDADLGDRPARGEPDPTRGRGADRAVRQPLPLHGLRRDREGRAGRRRQGLTGAAGGSARAGADERCQTPRRVKGLE